MNDGKEKEFSHLKALFVVVMQASFDLSLSFQTAHNISVLPADFMCDAANLAVFAIRAQAQDFHGERDADALLLIIRWWNALEDLQAVQCNLAATCLVRNHS